jgi:beta-phosphoglucomutase
MKYHGAIFDLDGVLVDTAKYHYLAWKELAGNLGFEFTAEQNEWLKGVSRIDSLNILLEAGGMQNRFSQKEKEEMASWKNDRYVRFVTELNSSELLAGAEPLLTELRSRNVKIALGSASKNAQMILKNTGIFLFFDAIVDGNSVSRAKPDPQIFLLGADALGLANSDCVVLEDSEAGLQAARRAGILAVGIGNRRNLQSADEVYPNLLKFETDRYF